MTLTQEGIVIPDSLEGLGDDDTADEDYIHSCCKFCYPHKIVPGEVVVTVCGKVWIWPDVSSCRGKPKCPVCTRIAEQPHCPRCGRP